MTVQLAIAGGSAVWTDGWPQWPVVGQDTASRFADVLRSGRWAVSGPWAGRRTRDLELAERFAAFTGARWCVPVDHGSSALLAALHALRIGPGDEVIVPGLTWVACASVVARSGATPVLVDIDPDTQCIDPHAVAAAVGSATAALLVVHLYSAMADMDALRAVATRHRLAVIEDAAQAYGATWQSAPAGSLGTVGAFSAQQGKTLTCGEGGLFVTSDRALRDRVEMLRGDGRRYSSGSPVVGQPDLVEEAAVQGWNMHLTEFQAALLLDGLERLPEQNRRRADVAAVLDKELVADNAELEPIVAHPQNDRRAYYHYAIRLRDGAFGGRSAAVVCDALSAELGYWIHPPYQPLNAHPLYDPRRLPTFDAGEAWNPARFALPVASAEATRTILLHHPMLLGEQRHVDAIVSAFSKVRRLADQLPRTAG